MVAVRRHTDRFNPSDVREWSCVAGSVRWWTARSGSDKTLILSPQVHPRLGTPGRKRKKILFARINSQDRHRIKFPRLGHDLDNKKCRTERRMSPMRRGSGIMSPLLGRRILVPVAPRTGGTAHRWHRGAAGRSACSTEAERRAARILHRRIQLTVFAEHVVCLAAEHKNYGTSNESQ